MNDTTHRNWTHWFEIPVSDFERAKSFYETIYDMKIDVFDAGPVKMGIFPHSGAGGAICFGEHYTPGSAGVVIYLDANPNLDDVLNKIEAAGGKVLQTKKQISEEHGFMALYLDSEGNRIALTSMQ
ncbi:MAG: VOC family protein [Candidatus Marinimicrobia bacterium]|nr:VOC family protein [Candidatus Neomarinimicrobiota bacterium]